MRFSLPEGDVDDSQAPFQAQTDTTLQPDGPAWYRATVFDLVGDPTFTIDGESAVHVANCKPVTRIATDVPVPIFDFSTAVSQMKVPGMLGPPRRVRLSVGIRHTYRSDLQVWLRSPSGTRQLVFDVDGSDSGDNVVLENLELPTLTGETFTGTWTLEVTDSVGADTGMLDSWKLEFLCSSEPWSAVFGKVLTLGTKTCATMDVTSTSSIASDMRLTVGGFKPGCGISATLTSPHGTTLPAPLQCQDGAFSVPGVRLPFLAEPAVGSWKLCFSSGGGQGTLATWTLGG
jgi:subtilisin-like proprotein convertase family protein